MSALHLTISPYSIEDLPELYRLFYETVHTVNARDYTPEQRRVWAPEIPDEERWHRVLSRHLTLVARWKGVAVGFADIAEDGYLDHLYVHKDFQGCGIATALCDRLENSVRSSRLTVHASQTAKPFFEQRGYTVVRRQQVLLQGVPLTNYLMEKQKR